MLRHRILLVMVILVFFAVPEPAFAYIGPGAGITVIGAALAFVAAIVVGIFGFIWYPLKRLVRAMSKRTAGPDAADR